MQKKVSIEKSDLITANAHQVEQKMSGIEGRDLDKSSVFDD